MLVFWGGMADAQGGSWAARSTSPGGSSAASRGSSRGGSPAPSTARSGASPSGLGARGARSGRGARARRGAAGGGRFALHAACYAADAGAVRSELARVARGGRLRSALARVDGSGNTPLHAAVESGAAAALRVLLEAAAEGASAGEGEGESGEQSAEVDVSVRGLGGITPLHLAAVGGRADMVRLLLDLGADVNALDDDGNTCLFWASASDAYDAVAEMLSQSAGVSAVDLLAKNAAGLTAVDVAPADSDTASLLAMAMARTNVHSAAETGALPVLRRLLQPEEGSPAKAERIRMRDEASARDKRGCTPLSLACESGHLDCIEFLVSLGVDASATNPANDETALHTSARHGDAAACELLLRREEGREALIGAFDASGESALYASAAAGHVDVALVILNAGGEPDLRVGSRGRTAMMSAAQAGKCNVIAALVKAGGDPNHADADGSLALHLAAAAGHADTCALLLESGSRFETDLDGDTPFHAAARNAHSSLAIELMGAAAVELEARGADGATPLFCAASSGDLTLSSYLIGQGANVLSACDDGATVLHAAAAAGNAHLVSFLLQKGGDFSARTSSGLTPLHAASWAGRDAVIVALIRAGADVNARTRSGATPLACASAAGHAPSVALLASKGASVRIVTDEGATPLHAACSSAYLDVSKVLIDAARGRVGNADIVSFLHAADAAGRTAAHLAASAGSEELIRLLQDSGANLSLRDHQSDSIWHQAASAGHAKLLQSGLASSRKLVDLKNGRGRVPLHAAAAGGHLDVVEVLIAAGARFNALDNAGESSLHVAAERGHAMVCRALVLTASYERWVGLEEPEGGDDVDESDADDILSASYVRREYMLKQQRLFVNARSWSTGSTALEKASVLGHVAVVEELLKLSGDSSAKNMWGRTPLHAAVNENRQAVVAAIVAHAPDTVEIEDENWMTPMHLAARVGLVSLVELLLTAGADTEAMTKDGRTSLHLACERRFSEIVGALLAADAYPDTETVLQQTPLHFAAKAGAEGCVALLVEAGSPVDAVDCTDSTPLHWAAARGHARAVEELLKGGATVDAKGMFRGVTPLGLAAAAGCDEAVKLLLGAGARVQDSDAWTFSVPLSAAADGGTEGHERCALALMDAGASLVVRDKFGQTAVQRTARSKTRQHLHRKAIMTRAADLFQGFTFDRVFRVWRDLTNQASYERKMYDQQTWRFIFALYDDEINSDTSGIVYRLVRQWFMRKARRLGAEWAKCSAADLAERGRQFRARVGADEMCGVPLAEMRAMALLEKAAALAKLRTFVPSMRIDDGEELRRMDREEIRTLAAALSALRDAEAAATRAQGGASGLTRAGGELMPGWWLHGGARNCAAAATAQERAASGADTPEARAFAELATVAIWRLAEATAARHEVPASASELTHDLKSAFRQVDLDNGGDIDAGELKTAARALGFEPEPEQIEALLVAMDARADQVITFEQLRASVSRQISGLVDGKARHAAFVAMDGDGDGVISLGDIGAVARAVGDQPAEWLPLSCRGLDFFEFWMTVDVLENQQRLRGKVLAALLAVLAMSASAMRLARASRHDSQFLFDGAVEAARAELAPSYVSEAVKIATDVHAMTRSIALGEATSAGLCQDARSAASAAASGRGDADSATHSDDELLAAVLAILALSAHRVGFSSRRRRNSASMT